MLPACHFVEERGRELWSCGGGGRGERERQLVSFFPFLLKTENLYLCACVCAPCTVHTRPLGRRPRVNILSGQLIWKKSVSPLSLSSLPLYIYFLYRSSVADERVIEVLEREREKEKGECLAGICN